MNKDSTASENTATQVCVHLYAGKEAHYYRQFTGQAQRYQLICTKCHSRLGRIRPELKSVTHEHFNTLELQGDFHSFVGVPGIVEKTQGLTLDVRREFIPALAERDWIAITPISTSQYSQWLLLDRNHCLWIIDFDVHSATLITLLDRSLVDPRGDLFMTPSPYGDYVAIISRSPLLNVTPQWHSGVIIDLISGEVTMRLDRGNYHTTVSRFSVAFFQQEGRTLVAHATDWDKLDVSDPATGACLTQRDFDARSQEAWKFKQNTQSQFTGALTISPDGQWIVDDGWVWHPVGSLSSWNLSRWLTQNVWEADNGPSKNRLMMRNYFWGGPTCWVDNTTLCVWGFGEDEENIIPSAVFFDVATGKRLHWIAGPDRNLFVFDQYLYTCGDNGDLSAWDVQTGARVLCHLGFAPQSYHPGTREFLVAETGGWFQLATINQ